MTAEAEILQELVKAVNCPDWWTIGITSAITIVNAAIMVWLGWKQYKLQKRQTESQEFGIYKKLFSLLSCANMEIETFLSVLETYLCKSSFEDAMGCLQNDKSRIDKLLTDFKEGYVDFELKISKKSFNKEGYMRILSLMSLILRLTIESLEKGKAHLQAKAQAVDFEDEDNAYAQLIVAHFNDVNIHTTQMQCLKRFIKVKKSVRCDEKFLDKIKQKCKIC